MTAVAATNVGDIIEDSNEQIVKEQEEEDHDQKSGAEKKFDNTNLKTNQAWGLKKACTFVGTCKQMGKKVLYYTEKKFKQPRVYKKGDAFGHFNFGSTIVLLFEAPKSECYPFVQKPHDRVKVGEAIYL